MEPNEQNKVTSNLGEQMGNLLQLHDYEIFPTDARYVNSFITGNFDISGLKQALLRNQRDLKTLNVDMSESMNLLIWLLRRIATDLSLLPHVFDYEGNPDYEDVFDTLVQDECQYLTIELTSFLTRADFRATSIQVVVIDNRALFVFGATNVKTVEKPKQRSGK